MAKSLLFAHSIARIQLGAAVTCKTGDLLGYDGTQWIQASADSRIPANFMAMEARTTPGQIVDVCGEGVMYDDTAPFTAGADQYLQTGTAGAIGALPAISTSLTVIQRIGKAADANSVEFDLDIRGPHEMRANVTYAPASLAANSQRQDTATLTGLATTDVITRGAGAALTGTGWASGLTIQSMQASAANTLQITLVNPTAAALTGASVTVQVYADRY